jgi:hypothetical protein
VGHAFDSDGLRAAKETQLEQALWASVEVLREIIQLYGALQGELRTHPRTSSRREDTRRVAVARKHERQLRRLIEGDGPAPTEAPNAGDEGSSR